MKFDRPQLPGGRSLPGYFLLFLTGGLLLFQAACGSTPAPTGGGPEIAEAPLAPGQPIKIFIQKPGMVELTLGELAVFGLAGVPETLQLFHQGRPQPLWLEGEGAARKVRFYGQAGESLYTQQSIYWLESGGTAPKWMAEIPLDATDAPAVSRQTQANLRLEENLRYTPKVETGDHFFWASLAAPGVHRVSFSLPHLAEGAGEIQVEVWGSTKAAQDPDHRLRATLNGQSLFDETWDGIGRHTLTAPIAEAMLLTGENDLVIEAPGGLDVAADVIFLDWVEIHYPRQLIMEADQLSFLGTGESVEISGVQKAVSIFDVTESEAIARMIVEPLVGDTGAVPTELGHTYLAIGPEGYLKPARLAPVASTPDLFAPDMGADYVAVGPKDLLAPLQPLLNWRANQGLVVQAVPLEAVYDQFNHGYPEPIAVQAFMQYAAEAWDPAPQYLLLVGDTTYDPRGYLSPPDANRLPTFMVQTIYGGETASDIPFGQLNDDPWPEIAIGRIPTRTAAQVETVVKKILAYESEANAGDWQRRVLAVADGREPRFQHDAQLFLDQFSATYQGTLVAPEAGAEGTNDQIREQLSQGSLLVAYFGHGSVTQWGRDDLFTVEDVSGLGNGARLPVVVNMTCLTGLFTHPEVESLAETLLWEPDGGAVAVLAPTSLTLPSDQSFLSDALAEAVLQGGLTTLGKISQEARRQIQTDTQGGQDVLMTFLLFGDPALRLANPAQ